MLEAVLKILFLDNKKEKEYCEQIIDCHDGNYDPCFICGPLYGCAPVWF